MGVDARLVVLMEGAERSAVLSLKEQIEMLPEEFRVRAESTVDSRAHFLFISIDLRYSIIQASQGPSYGYLYIWEDIRSVLGVTKSLPLFYSHDHLEYLDEGFQFDELLRELQDYELVDRQFLETLLGLAVKSDGTF